jgi:phenylacetate-CoA ligase
MYFSRLQRTQWFSQGKLDELQRKRLRFLLEHAFRSVPFYHRVFRARGLRPSDIKSKDDLVRLPIVTKDAVRNNVQDFLSRSFRRFHPVLNSTSGSTGEPFQYYIDRKTVDIANAAMWRGWGYAGYKLGDKMAVVSGLSLGARKEDVLKRASKKVIKRMAKFPMLTLRQDLLAAYAKRIGQFRPKFIRGYPSSIYFLAQFLKEEGIERIYPRAVLTTAEMLLPYQRTLIEDVLHCEVFDGYGAFDGGTAAFECEEHHGHHIAIEKVVMEFVDKHGIPVAEGETGRIIATDLFNYAMPFIRYDTKDLGTYSSKLCPCRRGLPLLKAIEGRTSDILHFRTGAMLSAPICNLFFKDVDIQQFQVVQTSDDTMVIRVVRGKTYSKKDTMNIEREIEKSVGAGVSVTFDFVNHISPTPSGKWKMVIRKMNE